MFSRERTFLLEAELHRGARRVLRSNGVKLKNGGELSGIFQSVLFCPEDLYLIREGAAARRGFLDDCICQLRPRYALALAEYKRLHEHKIRILRDSEEKPSLLDTLDEFSMSMAKAGALLIHYRAHFIKRLCQAAPAIHGDFLRRPGTAHAEIRNGVYGDGPGSGAAGDLPAAFTASGGAPGGGDRQPAMSVRSS